MTNFILRELSKDSNETDFFKQDLDKSNYECENDKFLNKTNHYKLTWFEKLCFAFGGLPYQMCSTTIGLFMPAFLLEIANIRPKHVSIVLFSGRVWDALSDPLIAYFVNHSNTRFGRLKPWIIFPAPFSVFSYIMLWYVPNLDIIAKTIWYLLFYCLFQTFLSCLHVPYTSLTMYITHDQHERDSATCYRMMLEVFGVLLGAIIQGSMLTFYDFKKSCSQQIEPSEFSSERVNFLTLNETHTKQNLYKMGEGYLITACLMGFIYIMCCMTTFFGTKELKDVIPDKNKNFLESMKNIFKRKSFITLLLTFLFNSVSISLVQTNLVLYCKYAVKFETRYQYVVIVLLTSSILSLPIWGYLALKLGKKSTYATGLLIFLPNFVALWFIKETEWPLYVVAVFSGLGVSANYLLPWSMLPDVIDEFMVEKNERKEAIFYSFYVFFAKLSSGLSTALSGLVLEYMGYVNCHDNCCKPPDSVALGLKLLIVPGPVFFIILALIALWKYPINEERRREIKLQLNSLRS